MKSLNSTGLSSVEWHVFYKSVYMFIDRLCDLAMVCEEDCVRNMLSQCLCDSVLLWYTAELTDLEKCFMRMCSLEQVYEAIIKQFKECALIALQSLQSSWYTMNDAWNEKASRAHFIKFLQHTKAAEFLSVYNQLILGWNSLSLKFWQDISEPTLTTSLY